MTKSKRPKGAALIELLIIFGTLLLPLSLAIANLGRIIWQAQFLSDIGRESARVASLASDRDSTKTCDELRDMAANAASTSISKNQKWALQNVWQSNVYVLNSRQFRANVPLGPAAKIRPIQVVFNTDYENSCLLCTNFEFLKYFDVWVYNAMDFNASSDCTKS